MVHIATDVDNKPELAIQYLEDLIFDYLLNRGEPMRTGDILECIGGDLPITPKLVRRVMTVSDRFSAVDRRWDLAVKFMEGGAPVQSMIQDVVDACGKPVSLESLTRLMAAILGRSEEGAADLVKRMTASKEFYFVTERGLIGLRDWLLDVDYDSDEELRFQNFEDETELEWAMRLVDRVKWDPADLVKSSADFLKVADRPVTNKTLSYLCWRAAQTSFDPKRFVSKLDSDARLMLFSGMAWATKGLRVEFLDLLKQAAEAAEEMPLEAEMGPEEVGEVTAAAPPEVTPQDLDEIEQRLETKEFVRIPEMVESLLEVSPGERGFDEANEALRAAVDADERFVWVGTDRYRLADSIPDYVTEMPEMLIVPSLVFESVEGERVDVELDDEGLEGGLAKDIESPLVQDIPASYDGRIKYVLTYPHFHSGTMPIIEGFFPNEPAVTEVTLQDEPGNSYDGWVNNGLAQLFGLEGWYENADLPISGAILHVDRTERPDEFRLIYAGETDPLVSVSSERIMELEQLGEEAGEDMSTFDIIRLLMEEYKKGIQFVTLFTEVNIVRRTSPRLVASILSAYHCFYQKQAGTSIWLYDERKLSQGFKKTKRKYVRK